MHRKPIIAITSVICALAFTIYAVLDTFVIARVYSTDASETASGTSTESGTGAEDATTVDGTDDEDSTATEDTVSDSSDPGTIVVDGDSYSDDHIQITITTYRENDTDIYVADIVVDSPEYLQTALAQNAYGKNVTATTSEIAEDNDAILAINGDYYGVQESGYVIRNGVLYRNTAKEDQEDLVIYADGSMEVINESDITAEELLASGAMQVLCFGPGLIADGQITVSTTDEVDKAMTSNPRTAIGVIDDLHYVFVVADGRTDESEGLSLFQLAEFMEGLGVQTAYNLDGGGSSTMYFNGTVVNNPTSGSKHHSGSSSERSVSDIVYIGY